MAYILKIVQTERSGGVASNFGGLLLDTEQGSYVPVSYLVTQREMPA